ncbi:MAG: hypothetical protein JNK82_21460 [Myxococcaceae bacterium]|nr:hypothetical protein [Myxococcaceae bacterium]
MRAEWTPLALSAGAHPSTGSGAPESKGPDEAPWIISRTQDLVWFQGSVVAGLALLAFFVAVPTSSPLALTALFLWGVLFDGTHVLGTHVRAGNSQGSRPWALLLVGPAIALLSHGAFAGFLLAAYVWAYWHLVRQHYGFLALYRRRANATDPGERRLETALLWAGSLYPYLRFSLTPAFARSGLPVLAPPWLAPWHLDVAAAVVLAALVTAVLVKTRGRLGPRHLLIAVVTLFHCAVFGLLNDLLAITATLTIFHNLQYHRIVWHTEQAQGRVPAGGLARYLGLGVALGLAWYGPRVLGVAFAPSPLVRDVLLGLGWGVAFQHYWVDGRIWKQPRKQATA